MNKVLIFSSKNVNINSAGYVKSYYTSLLNRLYIYNVIIINLKQQQYL